MGPYGQLAHGSADAFDEGQWAYGYLRSRGNTIEAGTSRKFSAISSGTSCWGCRRVINDLMVAACGVGIA